MRDMPMLPMLVGLPQGMQFKDQGEGDEKKTTSEIQVCMVGSWEHEWYGEVEFTRANLREMISNFNTDQICVDYQHSSLSSSPDDAIAAGWIKAGMLYGKERGTELWATVEWTDKAVSHIQAGEYKYISPEIDRSGKNKKGEECGMILRAVALTNRPFLEGMAEVSLKDGPAIFAVQRLTKSAEKHTKGGSRMDEKRIREILGLTEDVTVTEDHRNAALVKLDEQAKNAQSQITTLMEASKGKVMLSESDVVSLKAQAQAGADALVRLREMERDAILDKAISEGRVLPAERDGLVAMFAANFDVAKNLLAARTVKLVDLMVHGSDGKTGAAGTDEVDLFLAEQKKLGASQSEAMDAAYLKLGKEKMDAWRFREYKVA